ncbi:uncharacterized protein METZ01_LOCUS222753 [marine metagenome]|uniref:Uncharacterized protein n=1 Tax=marine metagenome TaxID=408172 RepID=A0A382G4Q5_9ZZZZ
MASSASSAAVAVCSVVARPRFFAHMREPSARFLSGYSLSPYLHIFSSRKNMLAVSPTSPILATSSSLVFSFHDSPVSSFSQLRLGNHAKTCWPFHAHWDCRWHPLHPLPLSLCAASSHALDSSPTCASRARAS